MCNSTILFVGIVCSAARAIWSACGVSIVSCGGLSPYCSWRFLLKQTVAWFFWVQHGSKKCCQRRIFPTWTLTPGCPPSQFTRFLWPHELQCRNRVRSTNEATVQQYLCWTTNSFPGSNGKSYFILNKSEWCAVKKSCFPTFLSTNTFPYLSQKCLVTWSKYWRRKRTMMWNAFAIICCIETRRFAWFAVTFSQNCERQCAATCPYSSDDSGNALVVTMQWWWWWWLAVYDIR